MLESLWTRLLSSLEHKIPEAALDTWVRSSRLMAVEGDRLQIAAPNKFSRDWLAEHYLPALAAAAQDCLGGNPQVSIVVDATPAPAPPPAGAAGAPPPPPPAPPGSPPPTRSSPSSSARPTSSPRPPARPWPSCPARRTTRFLSTAGSAWG